MMERFKSIAALGVLPVLLPIAAAAFNRELGYFDADPEYAYLLNGLGVVYLHVPALYSHPGTPVELLSAVIISFVWAVRFLWIFAESPQTDVLREPELYLWWINMTFAAMAGAAIYFLGHRLQSLTRSYVVALVAQASFFFSVPLLAQGIIHVAPEALLISLTAFLAALEAPVVFSKGAEAETRNRATLVGLVIGACIATKVTAGPLVLTAFCFSQTGRILQTIFAAVLGTLLFTLAVAPHYGDIAQSMIAILIHSGHDGTGAVEIPSSAVLLDNLQSLYRSMPEMFLTMAAAAAVGVFGRHKLSRMLLVSALVIALELAMLTKHPGDYYVVPAVAAMALANAGLVAGVVWMHSWRGWVAATGALTLTVLGLWRGVHESMLGVAHESAYRKENLDFLAANMNSGCRVVYYYDNPAPEFKLLFGNGFASRHFNRELARLYPNFITYNPGVKLFETFGGGTMTPAEAEHVLAREKCVRLVGSALERFDDFGPISKSMELVSRSADGPGAEAIYNLRIPFAQPD